MCVYATARRAADEARNTLLHDKIGPIMASRALGVFFASHKIKAALQRNAREKRMRRVTGLRP